MAGEDWAGVAEAINQRMTDLGLTQRDLIARSRVSKATVGELARNSTQRRRGPHILEALSLALDWHPDHLHAVLTRQAPPASEAPVIRPDNDLSARLVAVERQLDQLATHVASLAHLGHELATLNGNLEHLLRSLTSAPDRHSD